MVSVAGLFFKLPTVPDVLLLVPEDFGSTAGGAGAILVAADADAEAAANGERRTPSERRLAESNRAAASPSASAATKIVPPPPAVLPKPSSTSRNTSSTVGNLKNRPATDTTGQPLPVPSVKGPTRLAAAGKDPSNPLNKPSISQPRGNLNLPG